MLQGLFTVNVSGKTAHERFKSAKAKLGNMNKKEPALLQRVKAEKPQRFKVKLIK